MSTHNPYSPPAAMVAHAPQAGDDGDFWRDGKTLVARDGAELPPRCIKCNAPGARLHRKRLSWFSPWIYLLILCNLLVLIVVALIVRKRATLMVGLCDRHHARRRLVVGTVATLFIGGIAMLFAPFAIADLDLFAPAGLAIALALVGAVVMSQFLYATEIRDGFLRVRGCRPAFPAGIPPLPPGSRR